MKRARQRSQTGDTGQLLTQLDCWVPQKGLPVWPPGPELLCGCEQAAQPACLQSKVCAGTLVSRPQFSHLPQGQPQMEAASQASG